MGSQSRERQRGRIGQMTDSIKCSPGSIRITHIGIKSVEEGTGKWHGADIR